MRRFRYWPQMALVLALAVMNGGCILLPQLKDRLVELAMSGSVVVSFQASGIINTFDDRPPAINLRDSVDVAQILADAGVDVDSVTAISISGVAYRVSVPDPEASRQIMNGTVAITRGVSGGVEHPLVTAFTAPAGVGSAVTGFTTATLDPAGVADLNALLAAWLAELQGGPVADTHLRYHVSGDSSPGPVVSAFTWEVRLTMSIVGRVKVTVPT